MLGTRHAGNSQNEAKSEGIMLPPRTAVAAVKVAIMV